MGKLKRGGSPSTGGKQKALQTQERRDANVCYICGVNPICDIIGCPCRFVPSNLQGQRRLAAIVPAMTASCKTNC